MPKVCNVTLDNIDRLYDDYRGNLYYKTVGSSDDCYEVAGEFELCELKAALAHGDIELIFVTFDALVGIANMLATASQEV